MQGKQYILESCEGYFKVSFGAMASPCELLVETDIKQKAESVALSAVSEVRRIERKFSRYLKGNICDTINSAKGRKVAIDEECFRLLSFAQTCYELSGGMFDLSSGVLRSVWSFDCSDNIPAQSAIDKVMPLVGWKNVNFDQNSLQMKPDMEIDFGGIGKEYAVSSVVDICCRVAPNVSILVNLGGDIQVTQARKNQQVWTVGVESISDSDKPSKILSIAQGGLATSGDSKRYLLNKGKRYSHILNPKTGWPIMNAPSSVTVVAPLCVQAGCLATLALLRGREAEAFLDEQDVQYWCLR